ncbi:hypothetical protein HJFPF1_02717 [Paramyrothecium foliicola]|nr:hypothetical protein HJFPF1_02717 [Paramyrothecium foliicola]
MSQKGPAPRPAPPRNSRSPPVETLGSTAANRNPPPPGSSDASFDPHRMGHSNGDYRAQMIPPRALGVHNILNPSEPRPTLPDGSGSSFSPMRELDTTAPGHAGPYGPRPFPTVPQAPSSHPGTPVGAHPPIGGQHSSNQNSPSSGYPFPALNNPRKMSSPKASRITGLGQGVQQRDPDPRHQPFPASSSPMKRPYEPEYPDERRVSLPPVHHPSTGTLSQHTLPPSASRSLSQPLVRPTIEQPPGSTLGAPIMRDPRDPSTQMPQHLQQNVASGRPFSRGEPTAEGATGSPWPDMFRRPGMAGSLIGGDGQQAFMTLPGSDTPIPVQVDYSQASKKADEKRQRNAKASTRHRRKKKTMQEENVKRLQDLQTERQQMFQHIEEVTRQRDFYREERNRLRELVGRTATISELASGPPSPPASTRPTGFFTEESPLLQQSHAAASSQGYASDTSSVERPAQRRRTEDRTDYSVHAYAPMGGQPTALPPMQGQGYGIPPRPLSAASTASLERLPPLRAMEGPPPPQTLGHGHPQEQDPRTGQWVPLQTRYLETGWATAPRHPHDPSQR